MKTKSLVILSMASMVNFSAFSNTVNAEITTEDAIKFRQSAMMSMRWNMGKIKQQTTTTPQYYNKEQVIAAANVIAAMANSGMDKLFLKGSESGTGWKKTRVKADYFQQPDEVKKRFSAFEQAAEQLMRVAVDSDPNQVKKQLKHLFKTCKDCHKQFRRKN